MKWRVRLIAFDLTLTNVTLWQHCSVNSDKFGGAQGLQVLWPGCPAALPESWVHYRSLSAETWTDQFDWETITASLIPSTLPLDPDFSALNFMPTRWKKRAGERRNSETVVRWLLFFLAIFAAATTSPPPPLPLPFDSPRTNFFYVMKTILSRMHFCPLSSKCGKI